MGQFALDLPLPIRFGRDDFLRAAANAEALDVIEAWPAWPDPVAILWGPAGAGKSHLGAIWAVEAHAAVLTSDDLDRPAWESRLTRATLIDDADRLDAPEATLFHLLNLVRERGGFLLLTATTPPDRWGLATPDLLSRLRLAPLVGLREPDEALMRAILVKLFADRQLVIDESVVAYLVLHLPRSIAVARAIVAALDREALEQGRRVTRPMAARLIGARSPDEAALDGGGG